MSMRLVQLLLPLYDNDGRPLEAEGYRTTRDELTARFGGLTAHTRTPAEGVWRKDDRRTVADQIIVYEVMVERFDPAWWAQYRRTLEQRFRQQVLVVRALPIEMV
jgi:hypothetical protein